MGTLPGSSAHSNPRARDRRGGTGIQRTASDLDRSRVFEGRTLTRDVTRPTCSIWQSHRQRAGCRNLHQSALQFCLPMQEVNECEGQQRYKSVVAWRLRSSDHPTAAARALHRMHFEDTNLSAISLNYERAYPAIISTIRLPSVSSLPLFLVRPCCLRNRRGNPSKRTSRPLQLI